MLAIQTTNIAQPVRAVSHGEGRDDARQNPLGDVFADILGLAGFSADAPQKSGRPDKALKPAAAKSRQASEAPDAAEESFGSPAASAAANPAAPAVTNAAAAPEQSDGGAAAIPAIGDAAKNVYILEGNIENASLPERDLSPAPVLNTSEYRPAFPAESSPAVLENTEAVAWMPQNIGPEFLQKREDSGTEGDLCPLENINGSQPKETHAKTKPSAEPDSAASLDTPEITHAAAVKKSRVGTDGEFSEKSSDGDTGGDTDGGAGGGAAAAGVSAPTAAARSVSEPFQLREFFSRPELQTRVSTQENLFNTMVESMTMLKGETDSLLTVELKPDSLGSVQIQLQMRESGMHVKISADDPSVRSGISAQINSLIESLSEKEIKIAGVEVAYTGVDGGALTDRRGGGEGAGRESPRLPKLRRIESVSDGLYYMETQSDGQSSPLGLHSSVEFSA